MGLESSLSLPERKLRGPSSGSPVAMIQQQKVTLQCFEGLESGHAAGLPQLKNPAHRPKRQLPSAFENHEQTCRLRTERASAQSQPPATGRGQQPQGGPADGAAWLA